jgi:hypothetical protein
MIKVSEVHQITEMGSSHLFIHPIFKMMNKFLLSWEDSSSKYNKRIKISLHNKIKMQILRPMD